MHGARMKNSLYVQMYSTVYKWQYKCMVRAYSTVQHSTVQYSTVTFSCQYQLDLHSVSENTVHIFSMCIFSQFSE